jgi:cobalt-zinc-cadmium efflux system protein
MEHKHSHKEHSHNHGYSKTQGKNLLIATLLNVATSIAQIIGGLISNSLSLLSDALHNLGDSSALFIAFIANKISRKKPDFKNTFGYKRIEILAALFNGVVLIAICIFLFFEAYERFISPSEVLSEMMLIVATFGLLANVASIFILQKDRKENINVKAAYLHLLGDTLSSVAVIIGGIIMWMFEIYWIDPLISAIVGIYIIIHTCGIVKETVDILMQATPRNIDITEISKKLHEIPEIENIHHVHIWKLNDTQIHFEAHINLKNNISIKDTTALKNKIEDTLNKHFKISHTTIQFEYNCCKNHTGLIVDNEKTLPNK